MDWIFNIPQSAFLTLIGIIGLIIGSFLNVVILRLPQMLQQQWTKPCYEEKLSLFTPFPNCPHCKHLLKIWENIPLISFIFLKGKCSVCHKVISWRYPLIEILTAIFSIMTAYHYGISSQTWVALILTWSLLALTVIDIEHQLLPDNITIPILWFGLIANLYSLFTDINHALIGAIVGYLFLWSLFWLFKLITKKEGMGHGDFKLLAMLGTYLGWQALPGIVLISSVLGTFVGITFIIFKQHQRTSPFPFGPFLAIAGWIMLIWGNKLNFLYLSISGFA